MNNFQGLITRRDFIRGSACLGLTMAVGLPADSRAEEGAGSKSRVVLIRDEKALDEEDLPNAPIIQNMLDDAVKSLVEEADVGRAWRTLVGPGDTVGIKSNGWRYLPTPEALEQAILRRVIGAGVPEDRIAIDDRGILRNPLFLNSTALVNVRPLRTHFWSGIGGSMKNYIMFVPNPSTYHTNSCEDLASIWDLPLVKDKTRLIVLAALTPLFHGRGPHHFDKKYLWDYKGLVVGTDPVAVDAIGLTIILAKRMEYFGEERRLETLPLHIAAADTKHHLGTSDINKIELIKLGWEHNTLI
jgi:hypothetical protein